MVFYGLAGSPGQPADHRRRGAGARRPGPAAGPARGAGRRWFGDALAIDVAALAGERRPLARRCLDWTERRPHLAGALGAAILDRFLTRRWVARAESRALRVTRPGPAEITRLVPGRR